MIRIPLVEPASAAWLFQFFRGSGHQAGKTPKRPDRDANGAGEQHQHEGGRSQQEEGVVHMARRCRVEPALRRRARPKSKENQSIDGKRRGEGLPPALALSYRKGVNSDSSMKARQIRCCAGFTP